MGSAPAALRWRGLWIAGGALLTALVLAAALAPQADLPATGLNDRTEHVSAFLALTLWFAGLVAERRWLALGAALLALGAAIEFLQAAMALGRVADPLDFAADAVGVALGLALVRAGLGGWMRWLEARWIAR